jgi:hypothetical protein
VISQNNRAFQNYTGLNRAAATTPAVSVRNLVSPSDTGIKCCCKARSISFLEKSPFGPINIICEGSDLLVTQQNHVFFFYAMEYKFLCDDLLFNGCFPPERQPVCYKKDPSG